MLPSPQAAYIMVRTLPVNLRTELSLLELYFKNNLQNISEVITRLMLDFLRQLVISLRMLMKGVTPMPRPTITKISYLTWS